MRYCRPTEQQLNLAANYRYPPVQADDKTNVAKSNLHCLKGQRDPHRP
jgi:hypothetical protein